MLHRISAGAIIENDGKILLVHHQRPGRYDFWVCPGGGVHGDEPLDRAAAREVREETGLDVHISKLIYIEELVNAECRLVKFWFAGQARGGELCATHPEAVAEYITQASWLSRSEFVGKTIFPPVLADRYWQDRELGFPVLMHLPLRRMEFW